MFASAMPEAGVIRADGKPFVDLTKGGMLRCDWYGAGRDTLAMTRVGADRGVRG